MRPLPPSHRPHRPRRTPTHSVILSAAKDLPSLPQAREILRCAQDDKPLMAVESISRYLVNSNHWVVLAVCLEWELRLEHPHKLQLAFESRISRDGLP
jgi:hypothetical protein